MPIARCTGYTKAGREALRHSWNVAGECRWCGMTKRRAMALGRALDGYRQPVPRGKGEK